MSDRETNTREELRAKAEAVVNRSYWSADVRFATEGELPRETVEYLTAASPDAVLQLLAERDRYKEALAAIVEAIDQGAPCEYLLQEELVMARRALGNEGGE